MSEEGLINIIFVKANNVMLISNGCLLGNNGLEERNKKVFLKQTCLKKNKLEIQKFNNKDFL